MVMCGDDHPEFGYQKGNMYIWETDLCCELFDKGLSSGFVHVWMWNCSCVREKSRGRENSYRIIARVSLEGPSEGLLVQPPAHMGKKIVANFDEVVHIHVCGTHSVADF